MTSTKKGMSACEGLQSGITSFTNYMVEGDVYCSVKG